MRGKRGTQKIRIFSQTSMYISILLERFNVYRGVNEEMTGTEKNEQILDKHQ